MHFYIVALVTIIILRNRAMIKREGEELAKITSAQRLPHYGQAAQNSSINSRIFQYPFLEQNLHFFYPPPPYWHYEQVYHHYPPMPTYFRNFETPLCPPAVAPQNDIKVNQEQKLVRPAVTRSDEDSQRRVKVQAEQEQDGEADFVPPQYVKELGRRQVSRHRKAKYTSYYWSAEQNRRYMQFLINHPGLFELSLNVKKNLRVNVMMSKKVKTRSPQQCHSHHQKMTNKHGSIEKVIEFLKSEKGNKQKRNEMKDQDIEENRNQYRSLNGL